MQTNRWNEAWTHTKGMSKPLCQKSMIPAEDLLFLNNCYKRVFQDFARQGQGHLGLKVFIDQQRDYEATHTLMENPPRDDESLEEWGKRVFEGKKFGIILNDIQTYSPELMVYMAGFLKPLLQTAGLPTGGLGLLFFVGNYGFTPFGVHKENKGEEGLLFHIGPAKKTFYTWKTEDYQRISNNSIAYPPDELMDTAIPHELEPGDMMCIPSDVYHIGHTGDFSISMVLDFLNAPQAQLKLKMATAIEELMADDKGSHPLSTLPFRNLSKAEEALINVVSLDDPLRRAAREHIMKLESNGGFYTPSQTNHKVENVESLTFWKLKKPFPMPFYTYQGQVIVYARGHRIKWPDEPSLIESLKKWNMEETVQIKDLPDAAGSETLSGFQIICYLLSLGAIQKV